MKTSLRGGWPAFSQLFPSLTIQTGALSFAKQGRDLNFVSAIALAIFCVHLVLLCPSTKQVSGHDFSALPEMDPELAEGESRAA
jgi:hypothetical protein